MNNSCVWIGIGVNFLPNSPQYHQINQINENLVNKYGSSFKFDPVLNQPHLNIYDLDVPKENISQIEAELRVIAKKFSKFNVELGSISSFKFGTVFIEVSENKNLIGLMTEVVQRVVKYKGSCKTRDYYEPFRKYSSEQLENRENYGNPHVLSTFIPHITIGFIKTNQDKLKIICHELTNQLEIQALEINSLDLVIHNQKGNLLIQKHFSLK